MSSGVAPTVVPRGKRCWVCKHVAKVEDVTVRLLDERRTRLPPREAIDYLVSIGHSAPYNTQLRRLRTHLAHVLESLETPPEVVAPILTEEDERRMTPVAPVGGAPGWVRVNEQGVELGMDALGVLRERLMSGWMEDKDVIATAKLGQVAAAKRGDWEAKGRKLAQVDSLLQLAAGLTGKEPEGVVVEGEAEEV